MFFNSYCLGGIGGGESTQATDFWRSGGGGRPTRGVNLIPLFIRSFMQSVKFRKGIGDKAKEEECGDGVSSPSTAPVTSAEFFCSLVFASVLSESSIAGGAVTLHPPTTSGVDSVVPDKSCTLFLVLEFCVLALADSVVSLSFVMVSSVLALAIPSV